MLTICGKREVLKMNETLNRMCKDCLCFGKDCKGSTNSIYTGCVFKKSEPNAIYSDDSHRIGISREELEEKGVVISKLKWGFKNK